MRCAKRLAIHLAALSVLSGLPYQGYAAETSALAADSQTALPKIAAGMAAHRAQYTLTMDHARDGLTQGSGTMSYELTDACDGWAVSQHLQVSLQSRDGQPIEMVSDYTTFESKDGTKLTFHNRQTTEGAVTTQVDGTASLNHPGGTGSIHYTVPKEATLPLPEGTVFPTWHTAAIIAGAEHGQKFLSIPLFDGTTPDGAQDTSVVVTNWGKDNKAPYPLLTELPNGRVHIAFFKRDKDTAQPDFEVAMRYWSNGVADNVMMDFGDFTMSGKLTEFKTVPSHC